MTARAVSLIDARVASQPNSVRLLPDEERHRLIISAVQVDGTWVAKSLYGDDIWEFTGAPSNRKGTHTLVDFTRVPSAFRSRIKEILYLYLRKGREGIAKPKVTSVITKFNHFLPFLRYLDGLKIECFASVTPTVCATYVAACKDVRQTHRRKGEPLSAATLEHRYSAVEVLYELSQFTDTPIPRSPWPGSSAKHMAGLVGVRFLAKTPLIPDDVFTAVFNAAWSIVQSADSLLGLRDQLAEIEPTLKNTPRTTAEDRRRRRVAELGWVGSVRDLNAALTDLRTACYIVVASLSGCRNHELAYVQTGAYYRTEGDDGEVYWWMRSRSDKSDVGGTEWMIPEAAVQALRVMDRWALPWQARIADEIARRREADPLDPGIAEAQRHSRAVFLGTKQKGGLVRTLSDGSWCVAVSSFSKSLGLKWALSTHQFRRKFANYVARNKFGDLRYLREHFKHWSQDITNDGYALNESQEIELYADIQDELDAIKLGVAEQWLAPDEPLGGGYGKNLVAWRGCDENVALFRDHATMVRSVAVSHSIRSNGHAWCTADDNRCIGNTLEKSRCSGCDNAVISRVHARLYQRLYEDLRALAACEDIGRSGHARVQRDMDRCRDVLKSLGFDPEVQAA